MATVEDHEQCPQCGHAEAEQVASAVASAEPHAYQPATMMGTWLPHVTSRESLY
jgi:hypothetical protein